MQAVNFLRCYYGTAFKLLAAAPTRRTSSGCEFEACTKQQASNWSNSDQDQHYTRLCQACSIKARPLTLSAPRTQIGSRETSCRIALEATTTLTCCPKRSAMTCTPLSSAPSAPVPSVSCAASTAKDSAISHHTATSMQCIMILHWWCWAPVEVQYVEVAGRTWSNT